MRFPPLALVTSVCTTAAATISAVPPLLLVRLPVTVPSTCVIPELSIEPVSVIVRTFKLAPLSTVTAAVVSTTMFNVPADTSSIPRLFCAFVIRRSVPSPVLSKLPLSAEATSTDRLTATLKLVGPPAL